MTQSLARQAVLLLLLALSPRLAGQGSATAPPQAVAIETVVPAERYEPVFDQFQKMKPRADRVAAVHNLILRRDVIEFHLADGTLYLATPVGGRTVAAVFVGHGSVSLVPPVAVERGEVRRVLGDSVIDSRITALGLVFTDSSLTELERQVTFAAGTVGPDAGGLLGDALDHLIDGRTRMVMRQTLMTALLDGSANGFFYGFVKREHGEDLMFLVDPQSEEQVELLRGGRERGEKYQVVAQFKRQEEIHDTIASGSADHEPFQLNAYTIDATVAKHLDFSATTVIRLTARAAGMRWVRFLLFSDLLVDSVRAADGTADTFYRAKGSPELWVRLGAPTRMGEPFTLRVTWHGDLIGFGSLMQEMLPTRPDPRLPAALDHWLYVKASSTWFPRYGTPPQPADVDMTFHTPKRFRFASIGRRTESHVDGDVETSHWVAERPADQVCFNLGEFDESKIAIAGVPPVIVQVNSDAHRQLSQLLLGQRDPGGDVGGDVANSLGFFSAVYGTPLLQSYYATEVPFFYGQAFPGLMYFSVATFQSVDESGGQEMFRAHEMAHQWWGIGVEPAGYRDAWLSEGFAEFSGLWYMQVRLRDNDKFFKKLRTARHDIHDRRRDAPPIALGYRVGDVGLPQDYSTIVYSKGAWVLHMLRNLMINLNTMDESAFAGMMRDFYQQYSGRRASTRDFQRVVERHTGIAMDWFFDEWVNGTAIPTYYLSWKADPTPDGHYLLHFRVRQEDVPDSFIMPVPLDIRFSDSAHAMVRVNVHGPLTEATLRLPAEPKRLELNPLESVLAEVKTESWR